MRRFVFFCVGLLTGLEVVHARQAPPATPLEAGVKLVRDGAFERGLLALDGVVRDLEGRPNETAARVRAQVYLGVAYVGLEQETAARRHFKEAVNLDPSLQLDPGEFSPRVLRVFEAARKGNNKAVLYGGGIGILGIGAVVAGGALAGGAVAAAEVVSSPTPPPTPTPAATPTPLAPGTIALPTFSLPSGSTITGCQSGSTCNLAATVSFQLAAPRDNVEIVAELFTAAGQVCLTTRSGNLGTLTGATRTLPNFASRCSPPFDITGVYVGILSGSSTALERSFGVLYSFR